MATSSDILAWRIPQTEEPGGLQSMMSQRAEDDRETNAFTFSQILQLGDEIRAQEEITSVKDITGKEN